MKMDHERPEMPTSQWSLIAAAQGATTTGRRLALAQLLQLYYPALRAHLVLRMRLDAATADDVIQGFIADKVLDRELLATADPSKGRFRSLLLRSLQNYTIDLLRKQRLLPAPRDASIADKSSSAYEPAAETFVDPFDASWAREVLIRALQAMRAECDELGNRERWLLFERRVLAPLFRDEEPPAYSQLLDEFRFASPQQASNALITAKRHFQRSLCAIVGEYAECDEECAQELIELHTIVQAAGPLHVEWAYASSGTKEDCQTDHGDDDEESIGLATLFEAENSSDSAWNPHDYAAMWTHLLDQPLLSMIKQTMEPTQAANRGAIHAGDGTVGKLFRQSMPSIESLLAVKETARSYARVKADDLPCEIATALYFTSIATALVRLHVRLSKSGDAVLTFGFKQLAARPWLDAGTLRLVQDALRITTDSRGEYAGVLSD